MSIISSMTSSPKRAEVSGAQTNHPSEWTSPTCPTLSMVTSSWPSPSPCLNIFQRNTPPSSSAQLPKRKLRPTCTRTTWTAGGGVNSRLSSAMTTVKNVLTICSRAMASRTLSPTWATSNSCVAILSDSVTFTYLSISAPLTLWTKVADAFSRPTPLSKPITPVSRPCPSSPPSSPRTSTSSTDGFHLLPRLS